jgi:LysM repeat protein
MIEYTILKGDTLNKIAAKFHTKVDKIMKDNNLKSGALFYGQKLLIYSGPKPTDKNAPSSPTSPKKTTQPTTSGVKSSTSFFDKVTQNISSPETLQSKKFTTNKALPNQHTGKEHKLNNLIWVTAKNSDDALNGFSDLNKNGNFVQELDKNGKVIVQEPDSAIKHFDELRGLNRYGVKGIHEPGYEKGWAYIFFTTPSLNIFSHPKTSGTTSYTNKTDAKNDWGFLANVGREIDGQPLNSFLLGMAEKDPGLIDCLNYRLNAYPFIPLLSNRFLSFDPKDTSLKTKTFGETPRGNRSMLPGSIIDSIGPDQFNISYEETSNLYITKLHKIWVEYIYGVSIGEFYPHKNDVDNRIIDYLSSMYYITLRPDGRTIEYFCKYTGVAPLNVNYSAFGHKRGDVSISTEVTVPYLYNYKEDMSIDIIKDFNQALHYLAGSNLEREEWIAKIVRSPDSFNQVRDPARHGHFDYWLEINEPDLAGGLFLGNSSGQYIKSEIDMPVLTKKKK